MAKNVEIKATLDDIESGMARAESLSGSEPEIIMQEDVFFNCESGRLKLRILSPTRGELIFYRRSDKAGPKTSEYHISESREPRRLLEVLERSNGSMGTVRKTRRLYLAGRTRIHIDSVENLGHFIELEVVLSDGDEAKDGEAEARRLMNSLGISEDHLVQGAYFDLLKKEIQE
ncbi:MAG: class IV adenylate cyclase [Proteobacteria bacterium]|nr:class IV adenylate cyclase [Pseudomonadota bacterium]